MKELISKKTNGRSGWNVQHKIYPSSSNEKYTMITVDGYPTWTDAVNLILNMGLIIMLLGVRL